MLEYGDCGNEQNLSDELATVAALVFAMEQRGVLSKAAYGQALDRLWREQPGDGCIGDASAVIDRMFAIQGHDVGAP